MCKGMHKRSPELQINSYMKGGLTYCVRGLWTVEGADDDKAKAFAFLTVDNYISSGGQVDRAHGMTPGRTALIGRCAVFLTRLACRWQQTQSQSMQTHNHSSVTPEITATNYCAFTS